MDKGAGRRSRTRRRRPASGGYSLWLLVSLALIACGSPANSSCPISTVALNTFSGRPNPAWQLGEAEAITLRDILDSLDPTDKPFDSMRLPPYAGFLVEGEGIVGSARYVEVYDGVVLLLDSDFERLGHLGDPEYRVESYLFEAAESQVDGKIYNEAVAKFHDVMTEED